MSRLKEQYLNEIVPAMQTKFAYKNIMQVPKLDKIVINMGVSEVKDNSKALDVAMGELELIAGQKPVVTRARKSIAGFKIREGQVIGAKVTLRGENMYTFMEKLIKVALPRVRDFRGLSKKAFDLCQLSPKFFICSAVFKVSST